MSEIRPTAWQERVLRVPASTSLALLGGRGGGKTEAILLLTLRHVVEHGAAAKVLIIRRSFPALREVEERLVALFAVAMPSAHYNRSDHVLRVPSGGIIELGCLEGETDFARYVGRETTLLAVDEVTLWPSMRPINLLRSNLRSPSGVPVRTVLSGNPGGPGHVGIAATFVNPRVPWLPFELEPGDSWVLAPSSLADNPHLGEGYEVQLRAACGGDRALLAAWLEGNWSAIGGAFFADQWGPHLLLDPADAWRPSGGDWYTGWSFDFGMSSPGCALGFAVPGEHGLRGPGGRAYPKGSRIVLCEVHSARPDDPSRGLEWPIDVWADELKAAGEQYGIKPRGCADDHRGLGLDESVISELRRHGIQMQRPNKGSRVGGWARLKSAMSAAKTRDPDAAWFQIHPRCVFSIETIAALPRDPRRIEDADTSAVDHAADAARYAVTFALPVWRVTPWIVY